MFFHLFTPLPPVCCFRNYLYVSICLVVSRTRVKHCCDVSHLSHMICRTCLCVSGIVVVVYVHVSIIVYVSRIAFYFRVYFVLVLQSKLIGQFLS